MAAAYHTGVKSGPQYDSDVFESTFGSETTTLDRLSDSNANPQSFHSSSSLSDKTEALNEDDAYLYKERASPSYIDPASEEYLSPAKTFVDQKLKLLRAKLDSLTVADTKGANNASDSSTMQAPIQTDISLQNSRKEEKAFTEACLGRLNIILLSECSSVRQSRPTQNATVGTTKPFTAQYERLKIESLQHTIETQIKVG